MERTLAEHFDVCWVVLKTDEMPQAFEIFCFWVFPNTSNSLFGFSQTLQICQLNKMSLLPAEIPMEELDIEICNVHPQAPKTVGMVLKSRKPPRWWESLREAVIPNGKRCKEFKTHSPSKRVLMFFQGLFPILRWGLAYDRHLFKRDLMSGLTLASLSIPQSIGYANLAKLDPQNGLYTSIIPPLIYAVMGSSREIAIGPVAVVSLLLSSMVQNVMDPLTDPQTYKKMIFTATLFAGLFQATFGLFRLGFLVDFLSHAAIVGFMAGAAIVIGLQQLKGLLGISHFTNNTDVISVLKAVWTALHHPWSPLNFLIGSTFLIFILIARFVGKKKKKLFWVSAIAPLLAVIFSTLIVIFTKADKHGVKTVKHVQGGIMPGSAHMLLFTEPYIGQAAKIGLISAIIALTEAIAVGRSFAAINGYQLSGNQEMVAMGFMNIAGSISSCYVATGSFSRTAVNFSAGCKTAVSNIVMAITVFVALELLTKFLYYTPVTILASIILSSLLGLIDIKEACYIWEVDKFDFLTCLGAFAGVLFGSVEIGLLIAVIISFGRIILNTIRPNVDILGRVEGTDVFCSISQYPEADRVGNMLVIRINSDLICFANANFIRERIISLVNEEEKDAKENPECKLHTIIIDLSNVKNIETSGIQVLGEIHRKLVQNQLEVSLVNPGWQVFQKLELTNLVDKIGRDRLFLTVGEAVKASLESRLSTKCISN